RGHRPTRGGRVRAGGATGAGGGCVAAGPPRRHRADRWRDEAVSPAGRRRGRRVEPVGGRNTPPRRVVSATRHRRASVKEALHMETWEAITSRRNVREFSDRAIADADLERVLEAGRIAPSSQNHQPWDFIVVTDREVLGEL